MNTLESRVDAGINWLNKTQEGWVDKIDLNMLSLQNGGACIVGQIFGNYFADVVDGSIDRRAYLYLDSDRPVSGGLDKETAVKYGFNLDNDGTGTYDELTRIWTRKIKEIRAEVKGVTILDPAIFINEGEKVERK